MDRTSPGVNSFNIPGLGANEGTAQGVLMDLSGSVDSVLQTFNATSGADSEFRDGITKQRTWRRREFNFFVQDDFKLKPGLTLQLGMRYDYFGVPWEANGRTAGLVGGSTGLFGISGTSFADMYQPGRAKGELTHVQLIGRNSPNPNTNLYDDDWNNFGPGHRLELVHSVFRKRQNSAARRLQREVHRRAAAGRYRFRG